MALDAQKMNFDGILQSVMQNPEMLKGALSLAQTLSSSGALNGLFSQSEAEEAPKEAPKAQGEESRACVAVSGANYHKDTMRHRKLIEALCLYVNEEKREKLSLLLRLLELMELAEGFKR